MSFAAPNVVRLKILIQLASLELAMEAVTSAMSNTN